MAGFPDLLSFLKCKFLGKWSGGLTGEEEMGYNKDTEKNRERCDLKCN